MSTNELSLISEWFDKLNGDGEFVRDIRAEPNSVIGPSTSTELVIYATKPQVVSRAFLEDPDSNQFCMIGRHGLPNDDDLVWIDAFIQGRKLLFLGDMDPVDLLIFAWLRGSLQSTEVVHLGINDAYLDALGCRMMQSSTIDFAPSEVQSMPVLRHALPDLPSLVGNRCCQLLNSGKKLELEAVVSATDSFAALLTPARRYLRR